MNVRWSAVFAGWFVDFALSLLLQIIIGSIGLASFYSSPNLAEPAHIGLLLLFLVATAIGGFVAARIADESYAINGMMVGVTGILISAMLNAGAVETPPLFVASQAVGCAMGALGGWIAMRWRARAPH